MKRNQPNLREIRSTSAVGSLDVSCGSSHFFLLSVRWLGEERTGVVENYFKEVMQEGMQTRRSMIKKGKHQDRGR